MAKEDHFRIVNPAALAAAAGLMMATKAKGQPGGSGCTNANDVDHDACRAVPQHSDLPVCTNGAQDVSCSSDLYRGCNYGQVDCADGGADDKCCAGWGPGGGDNIDHAFCSERDADTGDTDLICVFDSGNEPPGNACGYLIMGFDTGQCPCE